MKVKGIKKGQTIELLEVLDVPDGEQVTIEVSAIHPPSHLTPQQRQERINAVLGIWSQNADLDRIFSEIDQERH